MQSRHEGDPCSSGLDIAAHILKHSASGIITTPVLRAGTESVAGQPRPWRFACSTHAVPPIATGRRSKRAPRRDRSETDRLAAPQRNVMMGHVWTAPAVQGESDGSAKLSGAAMYPACCRMKGDPSSRWSRYDRWP